MITQIPSGFIINSYNKTNFATKQCFASNHNHKNEDKVIISKTIDLSTEYNDLTYKLNELDAKRIKPHEYNSELLELFDENFDKLRDGHKNTRDERGAFFEEIVNKLKKDDKDYNSHLISISKRIPDLHENHQANAMIGIAEHIKDKNDNVAKANTIKNASNDVCDELTKLMKKFQYGDKNLASVSIAIANKIKTSPKGNIILMTIVDKMACIPRNDAHSINCLFEIVSKKIDTKDKENATSLYNKLLKYFDTVIVYFPSNEKLKAQHLLKELEEKIISPKSKKL